MKARFFFLLVTAVFLAASLSLNTFAAEWNLVQQGALAFTLWTGCEAPEQVMYDTLAKEFAE